MLDADASSESPRSASAERHDSLRLAQLIILLDEVAPPGARGLDIERLAYYEFFAANPFAIVPADDVRARARLRHAAFAEVQLSYASTGSRFANRRRRLQHDLARAVALGLVEPRSSGWGISPRGSEVARTFDALYAAHFRVSANVVHSQLRRLSDAQLNKNAKEWLRSPSLLLDLYGSAESDPNEMDVDDER